MASAGDPASNLAVQPPAASTEAVDLTAEAAIREDPGPAAATAAAAVFHVLSFCFFGHISRVSRVYALLLFFWRGFTHYLRYPVCTHSLYCFWRGFIHCCVRLHPTRDSRVIILHTMICSRRSTYRHERSLWAGNSHNFVLQQCRTRGSQRRPAGR